MTVGGSRIGLGEAMSKKEATKNCYLDVVRYLENCDRGLWNDFNEASKKGKDLGDASRVRLDMSEGLEDDIRDLNRDTAKSVLYGNAPEGSRAAKSTAPPVPSSSRPGQE